MTNTNPGDAALTQDPAPAVDALIADTQVSGHVRSFRAFYQDFLPRLVAFLLWIGARLPDAVEISQEAMTRAYQHWDRIEKPEAWARRVASREYGRRIASITEDPADERRLEDNSLLPHNTGIAAFEERHEVLRLLDLLPPRQRQVMAWSYDGYSPTEIAAELSISTPAVRSNLYKARRALNHHLARNPDR